MHEVMSRGGEQGQGVRCGVRGRKVVGYRSTKVYIKLDGWAVASVRVARGQENVLGGGVEFVVLLFSVVRHVDINLPRFAYMGVVSWARTSARRSAQESPRSRHTFVGRKDWRKTFSDSKEGYRPRPARRAISLDPLPYPRAQCVAAAPTAKPPRGPPRR